MIFSPSLFLLKVYIAVFLWHYFSLTFSLRLKLEYKVFFPNQFSLEVEIQSGTVLGSLCNLLTTSKCLFFLLLLLAFFLAGVWVVCVLCFVSLGLFCFDLFCLVSFGLISVVFCVSFLWGVGEVALVWFWLGLIWFSFVFFCLITTPIIWPEASSLV